MLMKGLPLSKVNPRLARRFAEATGRLAKTDRIDAELLARYGMLLQPRLLSETGPVIADLKELHMARIALVKDRTAARNRVNSLSRPLLKRQNTERLAQIQKHLAQVDQAIMTLIASNDGLKARFDILVSTPGLSKVTAFTHLIEMPELGDLEKKAAASLCVAWRP